MYKLTINTTFFIKIERYGNPKEVLKFVKVLQQVLAVYTGKDLWTK